MLYLGGVWVRREYASDLPTSCFAEKLRRRIDVAIVAEVVSTCCAAFVVLLHMKY